MEKEEIHAYDMVNGFTYIGNFKFQKEDTIFLEDYVVVPTKRLAGRNYDVRARRFYQRCSKIRTGHLKLENIVISRGFGTEMD